MSPSFKAKESGFTLLELIVTMVIIGILATMIFQYFGTPLTRSAEPVHRLKKAFKLQQVLENITEDYEASDKSETYLNLTLKIKIGAEGSDQSNAYGEYHVVDHHFIKFVSGAEALLAGGEPKNVLKVTIQNNLQETLTALFCTQ